MMYPLASAVIRQKVTSSSYCRHRKNEKKNLGVKVINKMVGVMYIWTSNSSNSMSGPETGCTEDKRPALLICSLKNRNFLDISPHRFTCHVSKDSQTS